MIAKYSKLPFAEYLMTTNQCLLDAPSLPYPIGRGACTVLLVHIYISQSRISHYLPLPLATDPNLCSVHFVPHHDKLLCQFSPASVTFYSHF